MTSFLSRVLRPLQASDADKRLPIRSFGLVFLAVMSVGLLLASAGHGQDQKSDADGIERKAIVHFATLVYREVGQKEQRRVPVQDLEKLQLVRPMNGGDDYWIELYYRGGDYVLQRIDQLVFLRRDGATQQMKLPVNLVRADRMGFPFVN